MTCLSVLLTLSGTLLFRLFRQQTEMTRSIVQTGTLSRLSRDFRADAHRAESVKRTGDNGTRLEFRFRSSTVTWSVADEVVHRVVNETTGSGTETAARETYLCPYAEIQVSVARAEQQRPLARLVVRPGVQMPPAGFQIHTLSASAAVGLDHRFAGGNLQ